MSTTHWTSKPITVAYSGSNINRDATFRYRHLTLWGGAKIDTITWDWQNGQAVTKIRLSDYNTPHRTTYRFQTGDVLWIQGFGSITVTDTNGAEYIWTDTEFDALQMIAPGTAIYQHQQYRFAEAGKTRLGAVSTTASIDISQGFKTAVQPSYDPLFGGLEVQLATHEQLIYTSMSGSDAEAVWSFTDNAFNTGSVAFISSDTADIPFQIGDSVVIEQEQTAWAASDNLFWSGSLAFTGSTAPPFPINTQITVTRQSTAAYNGVTSVVTSSGNILVTGKSWLTDTAADNAIIYGFARPEYNTVGTITNTYVSGGTRFVVTDIPWAGASPTIAGRMRGATTTRDIKYSVTGSDMLALYGSSNAAAEQFTIAGSDVYRTQRFASIYSNSIAEWPMQYRDECWLLAHRGLDIEPDVEVKIFVTTYNQSGNVIGSYEGINAYGFGNTSGDPGAPIVSLAWPAGPKQLETLVGLAIFTDDVATYTVSLVDAPAGGTTIPGSEINFRYVKCGIGLTPYSVEWRDSMGSIASWPFNLVSQRATDVSRAFWMPDADTTSTLNTVSSDKWRLQSDYILNDAEDAAIQDLIASKEAWLKTETELIPINISTSEYAYGNRAWGDLPAVSLDVVKAQNVTRQ
jgi:hypothetical protein